MPDGRVFRLRLGLLWLAGMQQMLGLLAVPPLIPLIHRDLGLNEAGIAVLTGLPVLLFAAMVVPGSLVIARLGARRALLIGLVLAGVGGGLRGAGHSAAVLFAMTLVMGVGIAIFLPAIPSLVSAWFPSRVGLATAAYVNGLLVGETLAASLTLPLVLPLVGGRWERAFAVWAAPMLLTALLLSRLAPRLTVTAGNPRGRWWPDWRSAATWRLGLLQGGSAAAYLGTNAFLPDFLRFTGRPGSIESSLTLLNAGQIPASLLGMAVASSVVGRRDSLLAAGVLTLAGLGVMLAGGPWAPALGTAALGFFFAFTLVLTRALPPLMTAQADVHRLSAGMFAIGYVYSFVVPLACGAAWDHSRVPATLLLPALVGTLTVIAVSCGLPARVAPSPASRARAEGAGTGRS